MLALIKKMKFRLAVTVAAAASLLGCASAPTRPPSIARGDYDAAKEYVTRLIQHRMKAHSLAALSIVLVDDQEVIWAEGFGHADKERNIRATAVAFG